MIPTFETLLQRVRDEYSTDAKGRLVPRAQGNGGRLSAPPTVDEVLTMRAAYPDAPGVELAVMLSTQAATISRRLRTSLGEDEVLVQWAIGYGMTSGEALAFVEGGRREMLSTMQVLDEVPLGGDVVSRSCSWCGASDLCVELDEGVGFICGDCLRLYLRRLVSTKVGGDPPPTPQHRRRPCRRRARSTVTHAEPVRGVLGGRRWRVVLDCGHQVERPDQHRRPPRQVACEKCRREARALKAGES